VGRFFLLFAFRRERASQVDDQMLVDL